MIKRTLFFGNPVYLNTKNEQLVVTYPDKEQEQKTVPIEDIGVVVLENGQITITNALLEKLTYNKVAIITCGSNHLPIGLLLPMDGHSEQSERYRVQLEASLPLKKNLWQQTVQSKILNQAQLLQQIEKPIDNMIYWATKVSSGDKENLEGRAANYYWRTIFPIPDFTRRQDGESPNHLLNYGYAILRAICARALVSSGMLTTLGIFHRNKYNAYCLADDIMEPYRPYVDRVVLDIMDNFEPQDYEILTTNIKKELLQIPAMDVVIDGNKSPLMIAMSRTTSSLYDCYNGVTRKILYPVYG